MDNHQVHCHRRSPYPCTDGVDQRSIAWRSPYQQKENCHKHERKHHRACHIDGDDHERHGNEHGYAGESIVSPVITLHQAITDPATKQGGKNSIDRSNTAENKVGSPQGQTAHAFKEGRNPNLKSTHGKAVHCNAQAHCNEGAVFEQTGKCRAHSRLILFLSFTPARLWKRQQQDRQHKSRKTSHHEGQTPSEVFSQRTTYEIAYSRAEWQPKIEDREHSSTPLQREKIGDQSGSNRGVACLSNTDDSVPEQQLVIGVRDPGKQREAAPDHDPDGNDVLARETVPHPAHKWPGNHVAVKKHAGEPANLCIRDVELAFDQRLNREQDRAVNVIEDVKSGKQRKHEAGIESGLHSRQIIIRSPPALQARRLNPELNHIANSLSLFSNPPSRCWLPESGSR